MIRSEGRSLAAAVLLAAFVSFAGIWSHSLWTPDEPTGSAVGRAMLRSGDLIVPTLNGRPFLEKPPLYWWTQVAAFRVFGVSDATARIPSAFFGFLTLVATYAIGRRVVGPRAGLIAVGVLATTVEFSEDMGRVVVDPALVFFITLIHAGFAILVAPRSPHEVRWATLGVAVATPLAFLAKGVVGLGLGLGPPVLYLVSSASALAFTRSPSAGDHSQNALRRVLVLAVIGVPVFAIVVVPWIGALYHHTGWAGVRECLAGNTIGRFFNTEALREYGHRQPPWFYASQGLAAAAPWILTLPAMLRAGVTRPIAGMWGDAAPRRLLLASCGIGVVLLSLAASKRAMYLVPLLPAFAVCVGWWGDGVTRARDQVVARERSWDSITLWLLAGIAASLPVAALIVLLVVRVRHWPADSLSALAPLAAHVTTAVIVVAGGGALLAIGLFGRQVRARTPPAIGAIVTAYLAVFLAYQTMGKALIDLVKNLHELTSAIARLDPGVAPVLAYRPNESLIAIVNFDLGRTVEALSTPEEMQSLFARDPNAHVIISMESARTLPTDLTSRLRFIYDETGCKASPFAIVIVQR